MCFLPKIFQIGIRVSNCLLDVNSRCVFLTRVLEQFCLFKMITSFEPPRFHYIHLWYQHPLTAFVNNTLKYILNVRVSSNSRENSRSNGMFKCLYTGDQSKTDPVPLVRATPLHIQQSLNKHMLTKDPYTSPKATAQDQTARSTPGKGHTETEHVQ